jgi:hypothetical protein
MTPRNRHACRWATGSLASGRVGSRENLMVSTKSNTKTVRTVQQLAEMNFFCAQALCVPQYLVCDTYLSYKAGAGAAGAAGAAGGADPAPPHTAGLPSRCV